MVDRRIQPDRLQGNTTFKPSAAASETFVPIRDWSSRSGLRDTVEALSGIAPRLERFGVGMAEDAAKEDTKAAIAAAQISEAADWKEAVDKGLVEPGASPVFRRVWQETRGKIDTASAVAEWERELLAPNNPLLNDENGASVQKWVTEKKQAFLNGKDRDYQLGAANSLLQAEQKLLGQHANLWSNRRFNEAKDDLGRLMTDTIREGLASGKDDAAIVREVTERSIPHQFAGLPRADVNAVVTTSIIAYAKRVGETDLVAANRILNLAYADRPDLAKAGATVPGVGKVPALGANIEDARRSIEAGFYTREQRLRTQRDDDRREQARVLSASIGERLLTGKPIDTASLIALFKADPGEARAMVSAQETIKTRGRTDAIRNAEDDIARRISNGEQIDREWILKNYGGVNADALRSALQVFDTVDKGEVSAAETRYLPDIYAIMAREPNALEAIGVIARDGLPTADGRVVRLSNQTIRRLSGEALQLVSRRDRVEDGVWNNVKPALKNSSIPVANLQDGRFEWQARTAFARELQTWEADYEQSNGTKPTEAMKRTEAMKIGNEVVNWVQDAYVRGTDVTRFNADQFIRGQYTKAVAPSAPPPPPPAPPPTSLPTFPMRFVDTEAAMTGAVGSTVPKPYIPKLDNGRRVVPTADQVTGLVEEIAADPEAAGDMIRLFDSQFGRNASYHYFNRWRAQQPNK